jgi:hypothetical protein
MGLRIMRERAEAIHAEWQLVSQDSGQRSAWNGASKKQNTMYRTEIHVKGQINPNWLDWFGELQVQESTCADTILLGRLPDMAAVYGVISRLGSLVIPLVYVRCVEESEIT